MSKPAPPACKVNVRNKITGHVFEAWPVDAREMVGTSPTEYEYATDGASPATADTPSSQAATPPAPPKSIVEQLGEKSYKDLQALAKKAGVNANQKAEALIEALVPHVVGGGLSLEELPKLAINVVQFPNAKTE